MFRRPWHLRDVPTLFLAVAIEFLLVSELGFERCGCNRRCQRRKLPRWPSRNSGGDIRQQLDLRRLWQCFRRRGLGAGVFIEKYFVGTLKRKNENFRCC